MLGSAMRMIAIAGAFAFAAVSPAMTQSYPARPITMIVPFAAGGPSDLIARLLGEHMTQTLGQQVLIENVGGAGGTAGTRRLVTAPADGYTILIHHLALAAAPALYENLGFDTTNALSPIGVINTGPMVIAGKRTLPTGDGNAFFAFLREAGDKVSVAHAGVGSNSYLCSVLVQQALGTRFTQVAYRGTGPAMNDLVAGHVDVLCDQSTTAVPQIEAGQIRAFAVSSIERLDVLKSVPTATELSVPLQMEIWHGLYAATGTPAPVLDRLNGALHAALRDEKVRERFKAVGTNTFPESAWSREAHAMRFAAEVEKWATVLKAAGVTPQAVR